MTEHLFKEKMPRTEEQFKEIRAKTSNSILRSALNLFATKGYEGTSINDIAKEAKISKGLIYNYFESKQKIGETIFKNLFNEMQIMFQQISRENDPVKRIHLLINHTINHTIKNEEFWKLYMGFVLQPKALKFGDFFNAELLTEVFDMLEKTFSEANIRNPRFEALKLGAILDGVPFHYLYLRDKYPIEEMRNYLIEIYSKENLKSLLK